MYLAAATAPANDNRTVWQITLHPSLTGGIGDSASGDQGLLVVVEPRDQAGNIVLAAGQTSVALIDPALSGEQARLARWDFSDAETQRAMHTGSEPGIHLRLPWRYAPSHDRLKVFVRFTTRDGRKLQAEHTIAVAPAPTEWTLPNVAMFAAAPIVRRRPMPGRGIPIARANRPTGSHRSTRTIRRRSVRSGRPIEIDSRVLSLEWQARPVGIVRPAATGLQRCFSPGR